MTNQFLERWHNAMQSNDSAELSSLLADEVVFHSPVVYTPQRGKIVTFMYLMAASSVIANESFRYISETCADSRLILEFETEMDGIYVNGIDIIDLNEDGLITEMKVMVRPLQAMNKMHEMMGAMLKKMK